MNGAKQIKDMSCMLLTKGEKKISSGEPFKARIGKRCRKKLRSWKGGGASEAAFSVFYAKRLKILNYILIVTLKRKVKDGERLVYKQVYITQKKKYIHAVYMPYMVQESF
jgi:hypothetical protein